jgi:CubicO group peptidase (beta-lactamase class C family)
VILFSQKIENQIDALFAAYDRPGSPGYAVGILYQNEFLYKKGYGQANLEHPSPITAHTVFDVGSMAKMVTGTAIALLEQEGRLDVDAPLRAYLPEFPAYAESVTLAHLLHHTSGMRNYSVLAYYMMGCHESDAVTVEQVYELLLNQMSLSFDPGSQWEYSDSNYFLLAVIVERVTGQTLGEYARAAIFSPLGMADSLFREQHSAVVPNRALSYVRHPVVFRSPCAYRRADKTALAYQTLVSNYEHVGAEGLFTSLEDLAKWARNYADNRLGRGGLALIERVLAPGQPCANAEIGYGYGVNVGTYRGRAFYGHDGAIHGYTSTMMHLPEEATTIICLSNHNTRGAWEYRDRIMDLIFEDCTAAPAQRPFAAPRAPATEIQVLVGEYQDLETASIWEIETDERRLVARVNRAQKLELAPLRPLAHRAADPATDLKLEFVLGEQGAVQEVRGHQDGAPFTLRPFLERPLRAEALAEYIGVYHCRELRATFLVDVVGTKIRLRNQNRHFCSMDLAYDPTIRDSFVAYDPHPGVSQITFLRQEGRVRAFVYRDYDGDGREDLHFLKMGTERSQ